MAVQCALTSFSWAEPKTSSLFLRLVIVLIPLLQPFLSLPSHWLLALFLKARTSWAPLSNFEAYRGGLSFHHPWSPLHHNRASRWSDEWPEWQFFVFPITSTSLSDRSAWPPSNPLLRWDHRRGKYLHRCRWLELRQDELFALLTKWLLFLQPRCPHHFPTTIDQQPGKNPSKPFYTFLRWRMSRRGYFP